MSQVLKLGLLRLSDEGKVYRDKFDVYLKDDELSDKEIIEVLLQLARLIVKPACAVAVARCFPQLVLQLLTLFSSRKGSLNMKDEDKENVMIALGKLVTFHPDAVRFSTKYFGKKDFDLVKLSRKFTQETFSAHDRNLIAQVLMAGYKFLRASGNHFRSNEEWSPLLQSFLHQSHSCQIKWLAARCIATVTGMNDAERQSFIGKLMPADMADVFAALFDKDNNRPTGRTLAIGDGVLPIVGNSVVDVGGVQLPVYSTEDQTESWFLAPNAMTLRSLALAVANGKAVCIKGPVGCGKTALVEHLARLTGRRGYPSFVKVQLGEQTDGKTLLGSYRCTDAPGEFIWTPGVLTSAVLAGHWLLLEDIDAASVDVAAIVTALLETGTLAVPGYRDSVVAASGFQLFLTQRSASGPIRQQGGSKLLEKHWVQINLDPLNYTELVHLVETMFPGLSLVSTRMVDVFATVKDAGPVARLASVRDLVKWCTRVVGSFDVASRDSTLKIFQDALDIFCANLANPELKLSLAIKIAGCLGLTEAQAMYHVTNHKPNISKTASRFTTGRVESVIASDGTAQSGTKSNFSFTRPSACLLESVACCMAQAEPVLLVGETGTGKTCTVQYLAECTQHKLVVINMNQQSDSADLLGGYKPVDIKYVVHPIRQKAEALLAKIYSREKVATLLKNIGLLFNEHRWTALLLVLKKLSPSVFKYLHTKGEAKNSGLLKEWQLLAEEIDRLDFKLRNSNDAMAFAFIEGSLVQALREGWWVLLDEINLASAETLECLSGLLEGATGSLHMLERGDEEAVTRHPGFRLFACMNPATDVGKKELPVGLRNRFTEFYVAELTERLDLTQLVGTYLRGLALPDLKLAALVKFYLQVRTQAEKTLTDGTGHKPHFSLRTLCRALGIAARNQCGSTPRSLYEALCVSFLTQLDNVSHAAVEQMVATAVTGKKTAKHVLGTPIPEPKADKGQKFVNFEGYWVPKGRLEPSVVEKYVLTASVRRNLRDLARVVSLGRLPVLIQGETSVGKTSLVVHLAVASGNRCVRINNHEHTDLQEYVGSYAADERGALVFKEGLLVDAMRKGDWIILDELNLAPSDVLEALNRVLDDNRELFIPETRETVKAHPNFMLFATQNPPGLYGGRKVLSRAFRNRFVELHFNEIPPSELETILHKRCDLPPSYCKKLIAVMTELQVRRKGSSAFAGKQGFITLRDLFRWGERYRLANQAFTAAPYDWDQHIADEGYLILAGRVRKPEEQEVIREVLRTHIKREVDPQKLFTLNADTSPVTRATLERLTKEGKHPQFCHIVWTFDMRRLAVLAGKALEFKEPVLLVGETGCGKTSVCQLVSAVQGQQLYTVNCHMHSESTDFLGGLRPVRDHTSGNNEDEDCPQRLFEWVDGPLITAMSGGHFFLADEISLADDSVLERLNSLLEPERMLLLAEKAVGGNRNNDDSNVVVAHERFHFVGTMNPGGDYGKKELSPALRNRFTEIWCVGCSNREDLRRVIEHNLMASKDDFVKKIPDLMLDFIEWFTATDVGKRLPASMRDVLSWVDFINIASLNCSLPNSYVEGAYLTFLDSLGSGLTSADSPESLDIVLSAAHALLVKQAGAGLCDTGNMINTSQHFGFSPFFIDKGPAPFEDDGFDFTAPTTRQNAVRVLRGLELAKPVLLEGSPGVGKTALVLALANAAGHKLTRINLSDQTDVCDLFGSDLPVEGGSGGTFAWRDGPFLQALKAGDWILIDELNLASQSVLEGLNACLDHRGEVYVPELNRTFHIKAKTRLFAAQNPLRQGGARRGLPKSFLNRFTQVHVKPLTNVDMLIVMKKSFPYLPEAVLEKMVAFTARIEQETTHKRLWGFKGSPWEWNLRDLLRWGKLLSELKLQQAKPDEFDPKHGPDLQAFLAASNPGSYVDLIFTDRMRTDEDRQKVHNVYREIFGYQYKLHTELPCVHFTRTTAFLGDVGLPRFAERDTDLSNDYSSLEGNSTFNSNGENTSFSSLADAVKGRANLLDEPIIPVDGGHDVQEDYGQFIDRTTDSLILRGQYGVLQSLARCVSMRWLTILVGPSDSGKTSVVRTLAQLAGKELKTLSVNAAMDTTEILGGFEQVDYNRHLEVMARQVHRRMLAIVRQLLEQPTCKAAQQDEAAQLLILWEVYMDASNDAPKSDCTAANAIGSFKRQVECLCQVLNKVSQYTVGDEAVDVTKLFFKLQDIAEIASESNMNAGGKFEWIDSVLVKCLKEGCWLLLDNVNLASAAVLDRLNGLLEPNGVLTIGERGTDKDGELFTLKPQTDFRIFMTMDPNNGEISRAMRNRGVEIFMPMMTGLENDLDRRALLSAAGLDTKHHEALTEMHRALTLANQGDLGVSYMTRTAFLLDQQISRGFDFDAVFPETCYEIYVRPNLTRMPNMTLDMVREIALGSVQPVEVDRSEVVDLDKAKPLDSEITVQELIDSTEIPLHLTLSTLAIQDNSRFAMFKQRVALLSILVSSLAQNNDARLKRLLYPLMQVFYESACEDEFPILLWIQHVVPRSLLETDFITSFLRLAAKVQKPPPPKIPQNVNHLPLDLRWLPKTGNHFDVDYANKTALFIQFAIRSDILAESSNNGNGRMSVLDYSNSIQNAIGTDALTDEPLIVSASQLVRQVQDCIAAAISSPSTRLDDFDFPELIAGLSAWFGLAQAFRLPVATVKTKGGEPTLNEDTLNLVYVNANWAMKRFMPCVSTLVMQDKELSTSVQMTSLDQLVLQLYSSLPHATLPLLRLGKLVRKELGQPFPYASRHEARLALDLNSVSHWLDIWADKDRDHRIVAMLTPEVQAARSRLIEAHFLLGQGLKEEGCQTVTHAIESARETFVSLTSANQDADEEEAVVRPVPTAKESALVNARVQLWPIQEFIAITAMSALRRILLENTSSGLHGEFVGGESIDDLIRLLTLLPSIPVTLVAKLRSALCSGSAPFNKLRAMTPLLTRMLRHTAESPAVRAANFWSQWRPGQDFPLPDEIEVCPLSSAVLTTLVLRLTVPPTLEPNLLASLGAHDARKRQLAALTLTLWRNAASFSSEEFDISANEWASAKSAVCHLAWTISGIIKCLSPCPSISVPVYSQAPPDILRKLLDNHETQQDLGEDVTWKRFRNVLEMTCSKTEDEDFSSADIGRVWLASGFLQIAMFANLGFMDPVAKRVVKANAVAEELDRIRALLTAYKLQGEILGHDPKDYLYKHEFISMYSERASYLEEQLAGLRKVIAFRPEDSKFAALAKETLHYSMSLAHYDVVFGLQKRIESEISDGTNHATNLMNEVRNWLESQKRFCEKITTEYPLYPDLVEPILSGSSQLCHGMRLLLAILQSETIQRTKLPSIDSPMLLIGSLVQFPVDPAPKLNIFCTSDAMRSVLAKALNSEELAQEGLRLVRSSLDELRNLALTQGGLDASSWSQMTELLALLVAGWNENQRKLAEKKAEEDSMFVTRTANRGGFLTDDQQAAKDLRELFPSSASDFNDITAEPTLEQTEMDVDLSEEMPLLSAEEIDEVCQAHADIVRVAVRANWIEPAKPNGKPDFVGPLMERYKTFTLLMDRVGRAATPDLDKVLTPSLVVLSALTLSAADGRKLHQTGEALQSSPSRKGKGGKHYDFYRDSRVEDVKECLPVLEALTLRVRTLLLEWPEHPTLNQTLTIIDRILEFPVSSPVARFLTGLEILLAKLQEWEENAHKGVSLSEHSQAVTRIIVTWRRLELNVWKEFLANTARKSRQGASRWWFLLHSLVDSFVGETDSTSVADLVDTLKRFIEESPLGEFEVRLEMLYTFHCHVAMMKHTQRTELLLAVLWNIHAHYAQFVEGVEATIARLRSPIEKKLKDFVKIARWNDISYWAIRETVEKTHRTLLKHVKEFEGVLKQPAMASLTEGGSAELIAIGDGSAVSRALRTPSDKCYLEPSQYVSSPAKDFVALELETAGPLLEKADSLFAKSRKLCKETILATPFTRLIQSLDSLVGEIIETANHLKDLEVSKDLEKDKQRSQAKAFLQQKRKALADLFRTLHTLGLSFKLGLAEWATDSCLVDWTTQPVDLEASLKMLKARRADRQLLSVWEGCDEYQRRSSARAAALQAAMLKPSADLGPPNIERVRGFAVNLMRVTQSQKKSVTESAHQLFQLRCRLSQLHSLDEAVTPTQTKLRHWSEQLGEILSACLVTLEQFSVVLSSCPIPAESDADFDFIAPTLGSQLRAKTEIATALKGDPIWHLALDRVRTLLSSAAKMKAVLDKTVAKKYSESLEGGKVLIPSQQYKTLAGEFEQLESLSEGIGAIVKMFESGEENPMVTSLRLLKSSIDRNRIGFRSMSDALEVTICEVDEEEDLSAMEKFREGTEKLMERALISVQTLYKRHVESAKNVAIDVKQTAVDGADAEDADEDGEAIEENHLKVLITERLTADIRDLALPEINERLRDLVDALVKRLDKDPNGQAANACKRLLLRCVPCLDQLSLLSQFLVTQQVSACRVSGKLLSVLLSLFTNLTVKGFCVPAELACGEDGGSEEAGGGLGLGEGEGEKDVSERIESQDQLDDARPQGEQRKDEDKDCKEEEKGIEMSDDFGGKTQDLEEKEKDGDSDDSDEEEPDDKEMGETEEGADKLDQEIWGDDDEEPEEEEEGKELEQEKGDGEKDGDPELGAKEDDGKKPSEPEDGETGNQENEDDDKKKQKKPEINEMQEPEVDDDHVDPYHGNQKPEPEPEDLDLPEDMQLDEGEANEGEDGEDNPFDIDDMKEQMPADPPEPEPETTDKPDAEPDREDSSDEDDEQGAEKKDTEPMNVDEEDEETEKGEEESGGKMGEEESKEEEGEDEEKAKPSDDTGAKDQVQPAEQMEVDGSTDQVALESAPSQQSSAADPPPEPTPEGQQDERDRVGTAPSEEAGHRGADQSRESSASAGVDHRPPRADKRKKPGQTDADRTLGDDYSRKPKKLKTVETSREQKPDPVDEDDDAEEADKPEKGGEKGDLFQHIKDSKQPFDAETVDAATKDQAEQRPVPNRDEENADETQDDNVDMQEDELPEADETPELPVDGSKPSRPRDDAPRNAEGETEGDEGKGDVEGEAVGTTTVARGQDTSFHTAVGASETPSIDLAVLEERRREMRRELETQLSTWTQAPATAEAARSWQLFSAVTEDLARNLSEQLRLVLEPTQASRLRGDFRTGRRINMRKVIPYIASHYRKDKIWLRRTKPSKREYQIVLAVDDSSSMADNRSKELAFESLAVVSRALTLLEAGELAVVSFGREPRVLHRLGEPFTEQSGASLLQTLTFEQSQTRVGQLVDFVSALFASCGPSRTERSRLLVVVSDGRGVHSEGPDSVRSAVRKARLEGLFIVFVIVDNPETKDSILDIRVPTFRDGSVTISPYLDGFPFPFYLILRDIAALPAVLGEALRQWFELVTHTAID